MPEDFFFQIIKLYEKNVQDSCQSQSGLDPDQASNFVGPDLGPNFLQSLSAGGTSRERATTSFFYNYIQ